MGAYTPYSQNYIEQFFRFADADGRKFRATILTGSGTRNGSSGRPWKGINPTEIGRHWAIPGYVRKLLPNPNTETVQEALDQLEKIGRVLWPKKAGGTPSFKQYLEDLPGVPVQDIVDDIFPIAPSATERLGFPTQKPQSLLERLIEASSDKGDVVLDPFCGCGTTIHAAQKLGRQWIGIDITYLAINLIKRRLKDAFGEDIGFDEKGAPTDFESAKRLAELDKFQFQHWALSLIGARPLKEGDGKGADRGVDGLLYYYETERKDLLNRIKEDAPALHREPVHREKIIVQVKGGGVNRGDVATLLGDVENQKAAGGVLITLEKPSKQMRTETADAGRYTSKLWHDKDYPRIQLLTVRFAQRRRARRCTAANKSVCHGRARIHYAQANRDVVERRKAPIEVKIHGAAA